MQNGNAVLDTADSQVRIIDKQYKCIIMSTTQGNAFAFFDKHHSFYYLDYFPISEATRPATFDDDRNF